MTKCLEALAVCVLLALFGPRAIAGGPTISPDGNNQLEIQVTPDKTGNVPSGSLSLETTSHLPVGSPPVAAEVTVKSVAQTPAESVVIGNFVLFGEGQTTQGYTFDLKKHMNGKIWSALEKGDAIVTVTVTAPDGQESKSVLELKSATFEK
ncbi:hypothetical protein IB276_18490 [Ensifer sp. ENS04]|uniref:hypothetical protein n=1 Tax=Ensifer sp. ENS04 TaxID=2769281 RepID=UPI00177DDFA7|nr:hypothetical protein [Ensifer sp. ENS04]MBD9541446.1 hypothetical protein [Ensifer sp. ENS04]